MIRKGLSLAAAIAPLLAGCGGGPPTVVLSTPSGPTTLYSPGPMVPGAPPPPGLTGPVPPPPQLGNLNGTYAGIAQPMDTGGGLCLANRKVSGFHVHGRSVRFGQFRGSVAPDGGVQMVAGQNWIYGQFEGSEFRGQIDFPNANFGAPGCTYMMTLQRVGP